MTRLGELAIALLIILAVGAVLAIMPTHKPTPTDPAVVARVERLEAEVEVLRRTVAELDLARWKTDQRVAAIEARVAIVDARTLAISRVVPVQAIRDRAGAHASR